MPPRLGAPLGTLPTCKPLTFAGVAAADEVVDVRRILTIGHSTHPLDAFVALLRQHDIALLADVRIFPRSRRHPHFNDHALAADLPAQGIAYRHFKALGGRRRPRPDSPNRGWEVDAFRAYADHALTPGFAAALNDLTAVADEAPTAVMCAEGLWWQCHRRLIADRLLVAGWTVCHIGADGALAEHALPPFAVPQPDGTVLYPPPGTLFAAP
jgi:uncharacterized protein (DUF488 family)